MKLSWKEWGAIAVALILTLGIKFVFDAPLSYSALNQALLDETQKHLEQADYKVVLLESKRTLGALKSNCYLAVGLSLPEGGGDSAFEKTYGDIGRLVFWYEGEIYPNRPNVRVLVDRYFERLKMITGARPKVLPLYHIAASTACAAAAVKALPLTVSSEFGLALQGGTGANP